MSQSRVPSQAAVRLDKFLSLRGNFESRSKAEEAIKNGEVVVNKRLIKKPSFMVSSEDKIKVLGGNKYVSRAALKLKSVAKDLRVNFKNKVILDVGSSTGGFSEFALEQDAKKVIAVDVGTDQMHPKISANPKLELHEKTDIRDFKTDQKIDLVLADVSFVSLTKLLPSILKITSKSCEYLLMCKPQFEASPKEINKGVVKNSKVRREILKNFEGWLEQNNLKIIDKQDSKVAGAKGNVERFYLLKR